MYAGDDHLFVIGAIEDADPATLGQAAGGAPEKIVVQLFRTRLLEAEDLAAFRVDAGHDVPDSPVFSAGIHALKDQQERITVGRRVKALQCAQVLDMFGKEFVILFLRFADRFHVRRQVAEADFVAGLQTILFRLDAHFCSFGFFLSAPPS